MFSALAGTPSGQHVLQLPGEAREKLAAIGLEGRVLVTGTSGGNFSRQSTTQQELDDNFATAAHNLGVRGFALPKKISPEPGLIFPVQGIGYDSDNSPNVPGMGNSLTAEKAVELEVAAGLAYGDAGQVAMLDVETGNMATAAGHWHLLEHKPFEAAVDSLKGMNPSLSMAKVYAFASAAARSNFPIDIRAVRKLKKIDDRYGDFIDNIRDLDPNEDPERAKVYDLDLGRFTKAQITRAKIPASNIWWDPRNTVADLWLHSKRRADAAGEEYGSGLFALAISAL